MHGHSMRTSWMLLVALAVVGTFGCASEAADERAGASVASTAPKPMPRPLAALTAGELFPAVRMRVANAGGGIPAEVDLAGDLG